MPEPSWTDQLSAWSTFATAGLTLVVVVAAVTTAWFARGALKASRAANLQAQHDSIEQTRPFVYAEVVPGLSGIGCWDIRITNSGRSSARGLTLDFDTWPEDLDDVGGAIHTLFTTPRTLPPTCSIRAYWRVEGNFDDGRQEAGLPKIGQITAAYTSDDPSEPSYEDTFDVMLGNAGFWPVPEHGPEPRGLKGDARMFYLLGQAIARRIGELSR